MNFMLKIFSFLLFLSSLFFKEAYAMDAGIEATSKNPVSLVFVHLGYPFPAHLPVSIAQARLFNPDADIYLIAQKEAYANRDQRLTESKVIFVPCEELQRSEAHHKFDRESTLNRGFWGGFWHFTTERFFFIDELMSQYQLSHVFHFENDVMIYVTLKELFPIFSENYNGIAAVFDTDLRVVPSFLYFKTSLALEQYVTFLVERLNNGETDMQSLAKFYHESPGTYIDSLPLIPPNYPEEYVLYSRYNGYQPVIGNAFFSNNYEKFLSIFDGAAIGQYFGGLDPRIGGTGPGFISETCVFDPSHFSYEWLQDEEKRWVPYAVYKDKKIRINNLHIHAKKLEGLYSLRESP